MSEFDAAQKWIADLACGDIKKVIRQIEERGYRIALVKGAKVKEVSPLLSGMLIHALKGTVREIEEDVDE